MVITPCLVEFCGILPKRSPQINEESEKESEANTHYQPSNAQTSEFVATAVKVDTFEIGVRDLCDLVDEYQSLTLVNE